MITDRVTRRQPPGATACAALVAGPVLLASTTAAVLGVRALALPGALLAVVTSWWLVARPEVALRVAIVSVLLPPLLLPPLLQSALDAGTVGLAAVAAAVAGRRGPPVGRLPSAVWLFGAFLVWGVLTTWWSTDPSLAPDLLRRYLVGLVLVVLVVLSARDRAGVDRLMGSLSTAAWIFLACGVYAVVVGTTSPQGQLMINGTNPNDVGKTLLLLTPGVLWGAVVPRAQRSTSRWPALVFLLLSLLLVGLSASRGSVVAYGVLVLAFALTRSARMWALTAAALAGALLLAAPASFAYVIDRFTVEDNRQLSRLTLWSAGLSVVADHPFGVGVGASPFVMPDYIDARTAVDHFKERDRYAVHNPFIEVAADTGVVGAALFSSVLVSATGSFLVGQRRARRSGDAQAATYGAVVGACLVAFFFVWVKSGGQSTSFSTFLALGLLLAGPGTSGLVARGAREQQVSPRARS